MKTVVVIGGGGFIGGRLVTDLAAAGHNVTSVSRTPPQIPGRGSQVAHVDCQFDNFEQLAQTYAAADIIFHLAWDTTPATSARSPTLEVTANLLPTARLLEHLQENSGAGLVFVSSGGTVYGSNLESPAAETSDLEPISYYGAGKVAAEYFIRVFSRQSGRGSILLRPSNVYGPGQVPKRQFGIVPTLLRAIRDEQPFTLIGGDRIARDFLFVDDFTGACLRLVESELSVERGATVLNLASGTPVPLIEVVRLAEEVTGSAVKLQQSQARDVDVSRVTLDTDAAQHLLGWSASVSLRDGLAQTWEWMQRSGR